MKKKTNIGSPLLPFFTKKWIDLTCNEIHVFPLHTKKVRGYFLTGAGRSEVLKFNWDQKKKRFNRYGKCFNELTAEGLTKGQKEAFIEQQLEIALGQYLKQPGMFGEAEGHVCRHLVDLVNARIIGKSPIAELLMGEDDNSDVAIAISPGFFWMFQSGAAYSKFRFFFDEGKNSGKCFIELEDISEEVVITYFPRYKRVLAELLKKYSQEEFEVSCINGVLILMRLYRAVMADYKAIKLRDLDVIEDKWGERYVDGW